VWDSGLAVGLAAKEVVGNMFGGASLFITRPFIIGEKIKVHITTSWSFFSN
jgi:MscS family membrane protein